MTPLEKFEKFVNTPGREIFTEHSEEIAEFIAAYRRLEDHCCDIAIELAELKGEPNPHWGT